MKRFPTRLVALAAAAALFGFGAAYLVLQTTNTASAPGLAAPPAPRLLREGQAAPEFARHARRQDRAPGRFPGETGADQLLGFVVRALRGRDARPGGG
jgi:hypothetical protein